MEPLSEGKIVVDELQIEDIPEDNKVIIVPGDTGAAEISPTKAKAD